MAIIRIHGRQVLDSRGNPTVEAEVITDLGRGHAIVPSGASRGEKEALELRDGGKAYGGKGVLRAVGNIAVIEKVLVGCNAQDQRTIDEMLIDADGTENKSMLGANAVLAVSLACADAASNEKNVPLWRHIEDLYGGSPTLPTPLMNVINGGAHAGGNLAFQEFMIVPRHKRFSEALRMGCEVYAQIKKLLLENYGKSSSNVGDEGGFAPPVERVTEPLDILTRAIHECGYEKEVKVALDVAPSFFYDVKKKRYLFDGRSLDSGELIDFFEGLLSHYPIVSIEDPMYEEDWTGFVDLTGRLGKTVQLVGDDVFVSNTKFIARGIEDHVCNALLLKVNQIGTLTEAFAAAKMAMDAKYNVVVSHRSGETEDTFIADLAVGIGCGQIKTGAPARSERTAKYNRLLWIEEEMVG
jgi:enolase